MGWFLVIEFWLCLEGCWYLYVDIDESEIGNCVGDSF